MRVLLTGSDGYIGVVTAPVLVRQGHEVVGLDTGWYRSGWLYNGVEQLPDRIQKDVRQLGVADLSGFDAVVHMAELSNDPLGQLNPAVTYAINYEGSFALATVAKQAGVQRFVYMSSCSVYGVGEEDELKTEQSAPRPQTVYAECKLLVEQAVGGLADAHFTPTFLRNATAFGPSPRQRFDVVLNNLAGLAWTSGTIALTSNGRPWRPLVHVLDIADAIGAVLAAPREAVNNEIFNVGANQQNYRVREIAEIVATVFPGCELSFGRNDTDRRSYRVDFSKLSARLPGFACLRDAKTGAQQLRQVFEQIEMGSNRFEAPAYTRLKMLQLLLETGQLNAELFWAK